MVKMRRRRSGSGEEVEGEVEVDVDVDVDVDPRTGYTDGFLRGPKDFVCTVRVRSEGMRRTVEREWEGVSGEGGLLRGYEWE